MGYSYGTSSNCFTSATYKINLKFMLSSSDPNTNLNRETSKSINFSKTKLPSNIEEK